MTSQSLICTSCFDSALLMVGGGGESACMSNLTLLQFRMQILRLYRSRKKLSHSSIHGGGRAGCYRLSASRNLMPPVIV